MNKFFKVLMIFIMSFVFAMFMINSPELKAEDSHTHVYENNVCSCGDIHYQHSYVNGICLCGDLEVPEIYDGVYQVSSIGNWMWVTRQVNVNKNSSISFELTKDLDFEGYEYSPIGVNGSYFIGTFNGNGYSISNIDYYSETEIYVGLFGFVGSGATIKNVIVDNTCSFFGRRTVGGIAGSVGSYAKDILFENCHFYGTIGAYEAVSNTYNGGFLGGIDYSSETIIRNSSVVATIHENSIRTNFGSFLGYGIVQMCDNCFGVIYDTDGVTPLDFYKTSRNIIGAALNKLYGVRSSKISNNSTYFDKTELENGTLAYKLGEDWGQEIGVDTYPVIGGMKIYTGEEACGLLEGELYTNTKHSVGEYFSDETNHYQVCSSCGEDVYLEAHSGGSATCSTQAECEVCGSSYGEIVDHNHTDYVYDENTHTGSCVFACGDIAEAEAHTYVYTKIDDHTHKISCEKCDYEVVKEHSFEGAACSCGSYEVPLVITQEDVLSDPSKEVYLGYYNIDTLSKYYWLNDQLNNNYDEVKYAKILIGADLNVDVVLASDSNKPFKGIFDGNYHTITLNLDGSNYVGLFGCIDGAEIRNLYLEGTIKVSNQYAGSVAAYQDGSDKTVIENVISLVDFTVVGNSSSVFVGGIIGSVEGSNFNIRNVGFLGSFSGKGYYISGITNIYLSSYEANVGFIDNIFVCVDTHNVSTTSSQYVIGGFTSNNPQYAFSYYGNIYYSNLFVSNEKTDYLTKIEEADIASGKLTYLLGSPFGQNIDNGQEVQSHPVFSDAVVYYAYEACNADISNITHSCNGEWISENGYHFKNCDNCSEQAFYEECHGGNSTCTEYAKCEICGSEYGEVSHKFQYRYDDTEHWQRCTECGYETPIVSHKDVCTYTNDSDDQHTLICECGYKIVEKHDFSDNGICPCGEYEKAERLTLALLSEYGLDVEYYNYYAVSNAGNLLWLIDNYNNDRGNVILLDDITINDQVLDENGNLIADTSNLIPWTSKMNLSSYIFEGNNKVVSGLYMASGSYGGFIYRAESDSIIRNLSIKDTYIGDVSYAGVLVGYVYGNTSISNINIEATILGGYNRGMLISQTASNASLYISNVNVKGNGDAINGLIGRISWTNYFELENVSVSGSGFNGLVASLLGAPTGGFIKNFVANANVASLTSNSYDREILKLNNSNLFIRSDSPTMAFHYIEDYFESGLVAYTISQYCDEGVWGQSIGTDALPVVNGEIVYCDGTKFTNDESECDGCENCLSLSIQVLTTDKYDLNNDGINEAVYEIKNKYDLIWFANYVNLGNSYANAILLNDIVLNEKVLEDNYKLVEDASDLFIFEPIGNSNDTVYSGFFDGNGKTISGLYVAENEYYAGLFGRTKDSIIKNLTVRDAYITTINYGSGGIVGYAYNSVIQNCTFEGFVSAKKNVGGITGLLNSNSVISECQVFGVIGDPKYTSVKTDYIGGVTGYLQGSNITNCLVVATLNPGVNGSIAGYPYSTSAYITNCLTVTNQSILMPLYDNNSSSNIIKNSYHINSIDNLIGGRSSDTLSSGQVALELNLYGNTDVWGQEIGVDQYPVIGGKKVYCNGNEFTNEVSNCYSHIDVCQNCNFGPTLVPVVDVYDLDNDGVKDAVYEIDSLYDLVWFRNYVNRGFNDINAILLSDIDLSGIENWVPIGIKSDDFELYYSGIFDGNNYVIKNLKIETEDYNNVAFFGYLNKAVIQNLGIEDAYVKHESSNFAIAVGYAANANIYNVYVTGEYVRGTNNFGALIAYSKGSSYVKAYNCFTTLEGLVGSGYVSVTNSYYINTENYKGLTSHGTYKSESSLLSGEIAYLLSSNTSVKKSFYQEIGVNQFPKLSGDKVVYKLTACDGTSEFYSNDSNAIHDYTEHFDETYHWITCSCDSSEQNKAEHIYDNACDTQCNDCSYTRTVEHTYDDSIYVNLGLIGHGYVCADCDAVVTLIPHSSSSVATETENKVCDNCDYVMEYATSHTHKFDNECDVDCNDENCPYIKESIQHDYTLVRNDTHHYEQCQICNLIKDDSNEEHVYTLGCDEYCNVCSYQRKVEHSLSYSYDDDKEYVHCSLCGVLLETNDHSFEYGCDKECNNENCEYVRDVEHSYIYVAINDSFHKSICEYCEELESGNTNIEHHYTDDCDADCDSCSYERIPPHSTYTIAYDDVEHWKVCDVCLEIIEGSASNHIFDNVKCECGSYQSGVLIDITNANSYNLSDEHIGYYAISSVSQFYWMMDKIYKEGSGNYVILNDITLNKNVLSNGNLNPNATNLTEIPYVGDYYSNISTYVGYSGTIDGKNHSINGLYLNQNTKSYVAFLGKTVNATIKNISFNDYYLSGNEYTGFIGICENTIKFENVTLSGHLNARTSGAALVGSFSSSKKVEKSLYIIDSEMDLLVSGYAYTMNYTVNPSTNGEVIRYLTRSVYLSNGEYLSNENDKSLGSYSFRTSNLSNFYYSSDKTTYSFFTKPSVLASGEITFILNELSEYDWGQEIGVDAIPRRNGMSLYCDGTQYTNSETQCEKDYSYCENCGFFTTDKLPTINKYDLDGDGIYDKVYEIATYSDLIWFSKYVDIAGNEEANAIVISDIIANPNVINTSDRSSFKVWYPIGYKNNYKGIFDGNNKTISGLYANSGVCALFDGLSGATVRNIRLVDTYFGNFSSGTSNVAALAADVYSGTLIENCYFEVYLIKQTGVSGIVSSINDSTMRNCIINATYGNTYYSDSYNATLFTQASNSVIEYCAVLGEAKNTKLTKQFYTRTIEDSIIRYCFDMVAGVATLRSEGLYHLGSISNEAGARTIEDFASGRVAYELSLLDVNSPWGQEIGVDQYPVLNGPKVYCNGTEYTNSISSCDYENNTCPNCGIILTITLNTDTYDLDNDGIKDAVYEIDDVNDLISFRHLVNTFGNLDVNAILLADIDMSSIEWAPIGQNGAGKQNPYKGIFDGNGHVISNLTINVSDDSDTGFFGRVVDGSIMNLGFENASISNTANGMAGILAGTLSNTSVTNVYVDGEIVSKNASSYALAGDASGSTLKYVFSTLDSLTKNAANTYKSYYISNTAVDSMNGENVTLSTVYSGKVTFELNGHSTGTNTLWKQTLDNSTLPSFTGSDVYLVENCLAYLEGYSNDPEEVTHIYDTACDAECNNPECGATREALAHNYSPYTHNDEKHYKYCYDCGITILDAEHIFDNECDTTCNLEECGYTRAVSEHNFSVFSKDDTHHYYECSYCGEISNKVEHIYDGSCDDTCNENLCAYVRSGVEHTYVYYVNDEKHVYACMYCGDLISDESHELIDDLCECGLTNAPALVDDYYQIETIGHLIWFVNFVDSNSEAKNSNAILLNDIDVNNSVYFGDGIYGYNGTFDGNYHEIRNVTVYSTGSYGGFFRTVEDNSVIKNLGINNIVIKDGYYKGTLVGYVSGPTTIYNCYVYGASDSNDDTSGLVGGSYYLANYIKDCISNVPLDEELAYSANNVYYVGDYTDEEVASGKLAYLLNHNSSEGVWKQTIGVDQYPNFSGQTVYPQYTNCGHIPDSYANTEDTDIPACEFDINGVCTAVEGETHYQTPTLVTLENYQSLNLQDEHVGYYAIKTLNDYYWFTRQVNDIRNNVNVVLLSDLDFEGLDYEVISQSNFKTYTDALYQYGYTGTFDGNKKVIKNVTITSKAEGTSLTYGLFGDLSGTVKNLGVENFNYVEHYENGASIGAIAGRMTAEASIINCYVSNANIISDGNDKYSLYDGVFVTGGIAGYALENTKIENVFTYNVNVEADNNYYGGIVGNKNASTILQNCYTSNARLIGNNTNAIETCEFGISNEKFASGEFAYHLNGDQSVIFWKQNLDTDLYPKFIGKQVYAYYVACGNLLWYSNDINQNYSEPTEHVYGEDGICRETPGEFHYSIPQMNEEGYFEIYNHGELLWLANYINAGNTNVNVLIMNDIDTREFNWNAISKSTAYEGIFDGGNNTIYYNIDSDSEYNGLFGMAKGATFKNIILKGNLTTSQNQNGALVGAVLGEVTVTNVVVDVTFNYDGQFNSYYNIGGLIGIVRAQDNTIDVNISNVIINGNVNNFRNNRTSGLIGYVNGSSSYVNSSAIANVIINLEYPVGANSNSESYSIYYCYYDRTYIPMTNVYFVNGLYSNQNAIQISKTDLESGKIAYMLNQELGVDMWKQEILVDKYPTFTGYTIYPIYEDCRNETYTLYSNEEKYVDHKFNDNGICTAVEGHTHYQDVELNEDGYYEIYNAGNLVSFARLVNAGNYAANAILMNDIDLSEVEWVTIADGSNSDDSIAYSGTFDGNTYCITNIMFAEIDDLSTDHAIGLFGKVSGTIKNLGINGFEVTTADEVEIKLGTIAGHVLEGGSVENVYAINVDITAGNNTVVGGLVGQLDSTLSNSFTSAIAITAYEGMYGGLVGYYLDGEVINSYSNNYAIGTDDINYQGIITNSEGLVGYNRFLSGEITYLLNNSSSDDSVVWGQILKTDNFPVFNNTNNIVYYVQIAGCTEESKVMGYSNVNMNFTTHTDEDDDLVCDYCGFENYVFSVVTNDITTYYDNIEEALQNSISGSVVTVLEDISVAFVIPEGVKFIIPEGVTVENEGILNNGTLLLEGNITGTNLDGEGTFLTIIENASESDIVVPNDLVYTGLDQTAAVKASISISIEILGKQFVASNWLQSFTSTVLNAGTYTVNYINVNNLDEIITKTFEVAKADIIVIAQSNSINYKEEIITGYTIEGLLDDDTSLELSGTIEYACDYEIGSPIGTYNISISGLTSNNYNIEYVDGVLTVTCGDPHYWDSETGTCEGCDETCLHETYSNGKCEVCAKAHEEHVWENTVCSICGIPHTDHEYDENGYCYCNAIQAGTLITDSNYADLGFALDKVGYYVINNIANFEWFINQVNVEKKGLSVILNTDLDLSDYSTWTPLGAMQAFSGVFDGNNHTISNFNPTVDGNSSFGFFGKLSTAASVKNLYINGSVTINQADITISNIGFGFVYEVNMDSVISNVHVDIDYNVLDSCDRNYVGGILGRLNPIYVGSNVTVDNSSYSGTIDLGNSSAKYVGGITSNSTSGLVEITNCIFDGQIIGASTKEMYVGGLIGYSKDGNILIKNNLVLGEISIANTTCSGLIAGAILNNSDQNSISNNYITDSNAYGNSSGNNDITDDSSSIIATDTYTVVNDEQLQSGEVAYNLGSAWGQILGEDLLPVYRTSDNTVYYGYFTCGDTLRVYTNDSSASETVIEHSYGEWIKISDPSTSETGLLTRICENDENHVDEYTLPALKKNDSTYTYTLIKEATCSDGEEEYSILLDGQTFTFKVVLEAIGHDYTSWNTEVPATNDAPGTKGHYGCNTCDLKFDNDYNVLQTIVIPMLQHTFNEWVNPVEANCEEGGTLGYYFCTHCNKYFDIHYEEIADINVKALGHNYGDLISGTKASCTETGTVDHYQCSRCDKYFDADYNEITDLTAPLIPHTYSEFIKEIPASCTEEGTKGHYYCSVCEKNFDADYNEITNLVIDVLDHNYSQIKFNENIHWHECVCGKKQNEEAHKGTWTVVKEATRKENGLEEFKCECGYESTREIEALGGISGGAVVLISLSSITGLLAVAYAVYKFALRKLPKFAKVNDKIDSFNRKVKGLFKKKDK